jgi:hypothetical protein
MEQPPFPSLSPRLSVRFRPNGFGDVIRMDLRKNFVRRFRAKPCSNFNAPCILKKVQKKYKWFICPLMITLLEPLKACCEPSPVSQNTRQRPGPSGLCRPSSDGRLPDSGYKSTGGGRVEGHQKGMSGGPCVGTQCHQSSEPRKGRGGLQSQWHGREHHPSAHRRTIHRIL